MKIENTLYFPTKKQAEEWSENYKRTWYGYSGMTSIRFDETKRAWRVDATRWNTCD